MVGGLLTPVRILNMGSGFSYGDVISIPDGISSTAGAATTVTLTTPAGKTANDAGLQEDCSQVIHPGPF